MVSTSAPMSAQALHIIGKTGSDGGASMPLIQHLVDTGNISSLIWDRWLPESTKRIVRESFGGSDEMAKATLVLLAGLHDIGKCTPSFAFNKHDCAVSAESGGFSLDGMHGESKGEYHSVTGQVIFEHYLQDEMGATSQSARSLGIVIGSHHGVTPNAEDIATAVNKPLHTGMRDQKWADAQKEIIEFAINALDLEHTTVKSIAATGISTSAQVVLAGIVIMADWLASDTDNFAVVPAVDMDFTGERAASAWNNMNLPVPWVPTSFTSAQDGLDTRFSTKDRAMTARPFQEAVVDMAQTHDGLLIVEAPMGEGKTEAALIAAETIAARNGAGGVFVALPTQATSNQMFSRTLQWLTRTTGVDEGNVRSVYLAHGKALLNDEYSGLIGNDRMITAHRWMQGRKRGALAPFVVGTIDQILSAALQSKHLTMRHLALTNKVVVLDEVHAVDTYMGSYLNRALEWLGFYGVPVIALSATLPSSIRKSLMKSYDTGRAKVAPSQKLSLASLLAKKNPQATPVDFYANLEGDIGYPVISASMNGAAPVIRSVAPDSTRNKSIGINKLDDGLESLVNELDDLLVGGGCVGIIRNTVKRAQETYEELKKVYGSDVILAHSRFVSPERVQREREITSLLGSDKSKRPERIIVVGTQVLEQSLDIDFDVMIIDMAPVDVMFQRIGRLHRHAHTVRPTRLSVPRCYLTGIEWEADVPAPAGGKKSFMVYPDNLMYRSLAVLLDNLAVHPYVTLPQDISSMVQFAYSEDFAAPESWSEVWEVALEKYEQHRKKAADKARVNQLNPVAKYSMNMSGFASDANPVADNDSFVAASVRDIDPSYEVVLLQRRGKALFTLSSLPQYANRRVDIATRPDRITEKTVASSTVNIPAYSIKGEIKDVIRALKNNYPGWSTSPWLNDLMVIELDAQGNAQVGNSIISYNDEIGLTTAAGGSS